MSILVENEMNRWTMAGMFVLPFLGQQEMSQVA